MKSEVALEERDHLSYRIRLITSRHCERSEAIQRPRTLPWIATALKRLAMTARTIQPDLVSFSKSANVSGIFPP